MAPGAAGEAAGEFERIRRYFAPLAGPGGLGLLDDAALVDCRAGHRLVMTADAIVAGVHYLPEDPPDLVAKKLLRVNLSDLAAMGARPLHYLLTTALPARLGTEWVAGFARGLEDDQRLFGIALLGGDSVATSGPAVLSLTAIGEVAAGSGNPAQRRPSRRRWSGSRARIGDAYLGLARAARRLSGAWQAEHRGALITRFQVPEPRVALGPALCGTRACDDRRFRRPPRRSRPHLRDLRRRRGRRIEVAAVVAGGARAFVAIEPEVAPRLATGGDDYELLFTAAPEATESVRGHWIAARLATHSDRSDRDRPGVRLVDVRGGRSRLRPPATAIFEVPADHAAPSAADCALFARAVAQRIRFCHVPRAPICPRRAAEGPEFAGRELFVWLTHTTTSSSAAASWP